MTLDINAEMVATAEYAIKAAKERFGTDLDFSESSIDGLNMLLNQAYQHFQRSPSSDNDTALQKTAKIWGSYLGEFIRHKWGGQWAVNESNRILVIRGCEISPIQYVSDYLLGKPTLTIERYLLEIAYKLASQPAIVESPKPTPQIDSHSKATPSYNTSAPSPLSPQPLPQEASQNSSTSFLRTGTRKTWIIIGAIALLAIIAFLSISIISSLVKNANDTKAFNTNLDLFLVEAGQLEAMTEQGVNNDSFRNQLAEVKSTYALLNYSWPQKYKYEKQAFDKAIEGWDLILDVWDFRNDSSIIEFQDTIYFENAKDYLNDTIKDPEYLTMDDWIGILMGEAGSYYEAGVRGVDSKK